MKYTTILFAVVSVILISSCAYASPSISGASVSNHCFSSEIQSLYRQQQDEIEALYKYFHQNPELSFREENTAKRLAEEFKKAGLTVEEGVGGFGVVGIFRNGEGPTVMIRTEMDALPVEEETGVPYASEAISSKEDGSVSVMHACGHDVHMASIPSTVRILMRMKEQWSGTLLAIGQPAEERGAGARAMLQAGLFKRFPKPDYVLAHHVNPSIQVGHLSIQPEYFTANVDSVDILVKGSGGHGAYPHKSKDPVVLASQIVIALQTIVSREVKPIESAVVTVGSIHGGTKHNIIPNEVKLQLTVRSYKDEVRTQVLDAIERISRGIAIAAGLPEDLYPEVKLYKEEFTPAGYNSPQLTERAAALWSRVFGEHVFVPGEPSMGGEDFALYGKQEPSISSLMFRVGAVSAVDMKRSKKGKDLPPLHSSHFLPEYQDAIYNGSLAMTTLALDLFGACSSKELP